jgi:citrate synthase
MSNVEFGHNKPTQPGTSAGSGLLGTQQNSGNGNGKRTDGKQTVELWFPDADERVVLPLSSDVEVLVGALRTVIQQRASGSSTDSLVVIDTRGGRQAVVDVPVLGNRVIPSDFLRQLGLWVLDPTLSSIALKMSNLSQIVAESSDGKGKLYYRGVPIEQIVSPSHPEKAPTFENLLEFLVDGTTLSETGNADWTAQIQKFMVPDKALMQEARLKRRMSEASRQRGWVGPVQYMINALPGRNWGFLGHVAKMVDRQVKRTEANATDPMKILSVLVSLAGAYPPKNFPQGQEFETLKKGHLHIARIAGLMPFLVAASVAAVRNERVRTPDPTLSYAEQLVYLLTGLRGDKAQTRVDMMKLLLVLHAEHTMNASTLASIVTSATGESLYGSVATAINTLNGPRHGKAAEMAFSGLQTLAASVKREMADGVDRQTAIKKVVDARLERAADPKIKDRIPGVGHNVYVGVTDPRAEILADYAFNTLQADRRDVDEDTLLLLDIASALRDAVRAHPYFTERKLDLNIDFLSGIIEKYFFDLNPSDFTLIFEAGRLAGQCAHWFEDRCVEPNNLVRGRMGQKAWLETESRAQA